MKFVLYWHSKIAGTFTCADNDANKVQATIGGPSEYQYAASSFPGLEAMDID